MLRRGGVGLVSRYGGCHVAIYHQVVKDPGNVSLNHQVNIHLIYIDINI